MNPGFLPKGVITALITPFTESGEVDVSRLLRNLAFQRLQKVYGVLTIGTSGESPTLDWREHERINTLTIREIAHRIYVLAGTGSNNTKEAIEASIHAAQDGADGVLPLDSYYNKPASIQLRDNHHAPVARAVAKINPECAVLIYVIPGRTCCQLQPADIAILAKECPNVRGVKEATGNLENMRLTRELVENHIGLDEHFQIMSGDDGITDEIMTDPKIRGNGVISVMSNIVPAAVVEMVEYFTVGNVKSGIALAKTLNPLFSLVGITDEAVRKNGKGKVSVIDKYPNPCPIKTMMAGLGMDTGFMRPPLGPMSLPAINQCRQALQKIWEADPAILSPINDFYGVDVGARLADDSIWQNLAA